MSRKLRKAIETLREISPKLNDATSAANEIVAQVEAFLNDECSIGLPCWVPVARPDDDDDQPGGHRLWLGYDRVDGKFRIALEQLVEIDGRQEHMGPQPWASCAREAKLTSLPKLPKLLQRVAEAAEKVAAKNDAAVEAVRQILGAMEKESEEDSDEDEEQDTEEASSRPASRTAGREQKP